jgi:hypothetical protein
MTPARVLVLEPAGPESAAVIATAARLGLDVHAALDHAGPACADQVTALLSGCVVTRFADTGRALRDITAHARQAALPALITPASFPTPGLILRSADPAAQAPWREFAASQAAAARTACALLAQALPGTTGTAARAAVLTAALEAIEGWRYQVAAASPHADGRYGTAHAEQFRTPVTDASPNLFRIGEPGRYRDGSTWDPAARAYTGGTETPASATMRRYAELAALRLAASPAVGRAASLVALPAGRHAQGTMLLGGDAARQAAAEIARRITARGGDASRTATSGDLIYAASAPEASRQASFSSAIELLAGCDPGDPGSWARAAWRLYQAPRAKRGTDAVIRVFLIAAGTCLLGQPPFLPHDIDLAAYVHEEDPFASQLTAVQRSRSLCPAGFV